jgi:hypothetical protein
MNQNVGFYVRKHCVEIFWIDFRAVLGFYAPYNTSFLPTFRDDLTAWLLKMRPIVCPETSIQPTLLKIPKDRGSHLHSGGILKARVEGCVAVYKNSCGPVP